MQTVAHGPLPAKRFETAEVRIEDVISTSQLLTSGFVFAKLHLIDKQDEDDSLMKKTLIAALLIALVALIQLSAAAQQIPYLSELLSRSEAFYKLYNEKRRAGANLSAIEPLRKRGEEAFRKGNIPGLVELMSEGMNVLQGKPWDEKQRFMASLTMETDRLVIEPNRELRVSLERIFPVNVDKAFASTPTVTFEVIPGENV